VHALVVAAARLHDAGEALAQPQPDRPRILRLGLAEDAIGGESRLRQREPLLEGEGARVGGEQQELGVGEGAARLAEQQEPVLGPPPTRSKFKSEATTSNVSPRLTSSRKPSSDAAVCACTPAPSGAATSRWKPSSAPPLSSQ
jgi:hypothetical protein